jgi:phosphatidate cytidylyltransferase
MFQLKGFNIFKFTMIGISLCSMILYYFNGIPVYYFFILIVFLSIVFEILRGKELNPIDVFISVFGFVYIALPFMLMNVIVNSPGFNYLIFIIVLVWVCDTFAYFGGKMFGKHQLSVISPKKTIEGSVIGFIFTVIFSLIFYFAVPEMTLINSLVIGAIVGIFSQIGDLFESLLKRYCGVKDSSHIIPGHGGVLDRFDSLIFIIPIIYLYVNLL